MFTYCCAYLVTVALVAASGDLGLEAFLPSVERTVTPHTGEADIPHLPLTDTWEDGHFTLRDVVTGTARTNVRDWALQLLQRYRFVIGETPSHFAMLSGPSAFTTMVQHLQKHPDVSLLCINDDVAVDDNRVADQFKTWATENWGTPAQWER